MRGASDIGRGAVQVDRRIAGQTGSERDERSAIEVEPVEIEGAMRALIEERR